MSPKVPIGVRGLPTTLAFIAIIGTLSYAAPAWLRRWQHIKNTYGHHATALAASHPRTSQDSPAVI
jgi:hypothetical protein